MTEEKLSLGDLLKTHKILMLHQPLQPDEIGYFRQVPVYIGGRSAMHHSEIRHALASWLLMMNDPQTKESWKDLHIEYEGIHPFVDGNGRTGRMFMNWQRLKNGLPLLIVKDSEKRDYYDWFGN